MSTFYEKTSNNNTSQSPKTKWASLKDRLSTIGIVALILVISIPAFFILATPITVPYLYYYLKYKTFWGYRHSDILFLFAWALSTIYILVQIMYCMSQEDEQVQNLPAVSLAMLLLSFYWFHDDQSGYFSLFSKAIHKGYSIVCSEGYYQEQLRKPRVFFSLSGKCMVASNGKSFPCKSCQIESPDPKITHIKKPATNLKASEVLICGNGTLLRSFKIETMGSRCLVQNFSEERSFPCSDCKPASDL